MTKTTEERLQRLQQQYRSETSPNIKADIRSQMISLRTGTTTDTSILKIEDYSFPYGKRSISRSERFKATQGTDAAALYQEYLSKKNQTEK